MASDRPIFILGCPRSGMTLLQLMLHAHPRIAIPPETRFVLSGYEHREAYGDLREPGNRKALADWIVAGPETRFRNLGLDPHEVAAEITSGPPTLGSALGIVLRAYARRFGKPRWGDKRPGYVQYIDALLRLFPDAQIVHLIRDGRDCVASLKRMPWWRLGTYQAIATWTQAIDAGWTAARRLPPTSYHELRYERLVTDPKTQLRALCAFLEEEYDPAMARPEGVTGIGVPRWRNGSIGVPDDSSIGVWPRRLEAWEAQLCETVMTDRLLAYGYELSAVGAPAAHHLARYSAVTTRRRLAAHKRALLDRRIREPQPVASLLTGETLV